MALVAPGPWSSRPLLIDELDYALPPGRFSWLPSLAEVVVVSRTWALVLVWALARTAQAQQLNACESSAAYDDYRTGLYWATERGSDAPALETAERHFHAALSKLDQLPAGSCRQALERKVLLQLRILYQQDGWPLLPWKGWNAGQHDPYLPGVGFVAGVFVTNDPAPSFEDSRMRGFTAEAAFANSPMRTGGTSVPGPLSDVQRWQIVRAPTQISTRYGATLRENVLGRFTFDVLSARVNEGQITNYYLPLRRNDTQTTQLRVRYDRVFPIDPIVDLRLAAQFSRVNARGFVEFLPNEEQEYSVYGIAPSLSRTIGPGRLTLTGTYLFADIPEPPIANPGEYARGAWVRGLHLEYAKLADETFNPFAWGSFTPYRTVSEGFAAYLGFTNRPTQQGLSTRTHDDLYGGLHWEGPKPLAFQIEAAAFRNKVSEIRADDIELRERLDPFQGFSSLRLLALPKVRLLHMNRVDPQPLALGNAQLADLTLVFPISWEFALDGPSNYDPTDTVDHGNDYAHFRVGSEFWLRSLSFEPLGGSVMLNAGVDLVHYYEIGKTQHLAHAGAALGW